MPCDRAFDHDVSSVQLRNFQSRGTHPVKTRISENGSDVMNSDSLSSNERLYATRDHYALSPHFERHMLALTGEGLQSKSAIAAELAHRDVKIERLRAALEEAIEGAEEITPGIIKVTPWSTGWLRNIQKMLAG